MRYPISEYAPVLTQSYERAHSSYLLLLRRVGHGLSSVEPLEVHDTTHETHEDFGASPSLTECVSCAGLPTHFEDLERPEIVGSSAGLTVLLTRAKDGLLRGLRWGERSECETCRFLDHYSQ